MTPEELAYAAYSVKKTEMSRTFDELPSTSQDAWKHVVSTLMSRVICVMLNSYHTVHFLAPLNYDMKMLAKEFGNHPTDSITRENERFVNWLVETKGFVRVFVSEIPNPLDH